MKKQMQIDDMTLCRIYTIRKTGPASPHPIEFLRIADAKSRLNVVQ